MQKEMIGLFTLTAVALLGGCGGIVGQLPEAMPSRSVQTVRVAPSEDDATGQIQSAIDKAFLSGGGTVRLTKGEYRIGGIRLRSRVTLYLETGAKLKGSRNIEDYYILEKDTVEPVDPKLISHERWYQSDTLYKDTIWRYPGNRWNNALIRLYKAEDAAIIGEPGSQIDGSSPYDPEGEEQYRGPLGINAIDCKRLKFKGYTINGTGNWAHRLVDVVGFEFDNVTCLGGHDSIHFNGCDDVLIENCTFKTGDDCVAGFDNHRVTVRNCYINSSCSAFRFGGNDVLVEKCTGRCKSFFHVQSWSQYHDAKGRSPAELKSHADGVTLRDNVIEAKNVKDLVRRDDVFEISNLVFENNLVNGVEVK